MGSVKQAGNPLGNQTWSIEPLLRTLLDGMPRTMQELVEESGAARRSIVDLFATHGIHSEGNRTRYVLSDPGITAIRETLAALDRGRSSAHGRANDHVLSAVRSWLQDIPSPRKDLDHVQAIPETVLARTRFLINTFDVNSTRFFFLGDHDLNAPALALAAPEAHIVVVDIDSGLLDYEADLMERIRASNASLSFSDFRIGLPHALVGGSDVVVTDPPYSDEGMALFLRRGLQALDPYTADQRLVVAYGHSRLRPDLGSKVQRSILKTGVVIDQLHRGFNRYSGAEALGSRSDLYVLQPTPQTLKKRDSGASSARIYTHGKASQESAATPISRSLLPDVVAWLGSEEFDLISGIEGSADLVAHAHNVLSIGDLVRKPPVLQTRRVVLDARGMSHDTLWHYVLALGLFRVDAFIVVFDSNGRAANWSQALATILELCEQGKTAVAIAPNAIGVRVKEKAPVSTWSFLMRKPHGSLRSAWRDAIVRAGAAQHLTITKNEAREIVDRDAPKGSLARRLIDLPLCQLRSIAVKPSSLRGQHN